LLLPKNEFIERLSFIILCAGEGTRLKEITRTIPKPLIKIKALKNISILNHTINNLLNLKIQKIAIVIGYLGDIIREFISNLIERNQFLYNKVIIIDTENQYKLGSLYSFLAITNNKSIFTRDKYYLLIPGDTIFDFSLLKEILSIISNNIKIIQNHPIIFYKTIELKEIYDELLIISNAEVENLDSENILKRISQVRIKDLPYKGVLNQIIPFSVLNYDFINEILNLKEEIPYNTVWESLNYMINNGKKIYAFEIESKHQFYDIDNKNDLKSLKKKRDNRCSD
jgi:NDP-sugar pyrophosphorylase family protein